MSNKTFTQQTKDWVEFLEGVKKCHFIGEKSTGKNGEEYGKICMKPSMKNFMEERGWYYQEYPCGFFNGTHDSCTNGDECHFGHKYSPRWVKGKPRRNCETSSSQASSRDNTTEEETTIPDEVSVDSMNTGVTEIHQSLNLVRSSPTSGDSAPLSSGSWNGRDIISPPKARKFSTDPEIKKWQKRLYSAEDFLCELKTDPEFDEEISADAITQGEKVIEKVKEKIDALKKAKVDEKANKVFSWADDDSSDDEA